MGPYAIGLLFVVISQLISIPYCIAAHAMQSQMAYLAFGVLTAVTGFYVQPYISDALQASGYATPVDTLVGRFVGSSTYAFVALRMFGAAAKTTPKGADADVKTWITFATAPSDPLFDDDGKPIRPPPGSVFSRMITIALRMALLSVLSSVSQPLDWYPLSSLAATDGRGSPAVLLATIFDHVFVQLVLIWSFLAVAFDVGALLLLAQGLKPLSAFDNPLFQTKTPRDFWGRRWNLQVTTSFKRCVFLPLRKLGTPPTTAALTTFVASGLFHVRCPCTANFQRPSF